jgi:hypothetical protein
VQLIGVAKVTQIFNTTSFFLSMDIIFSVFSVSICELLAINMYS